ncbi:hypothetical protein LO772_16615 [Yinghuangia sp. ASG 101]|uniref:hypothetical protein n=1 Tax=Yinghuangia sp. ASG 101 TaxID=2896848 RepID=UPI001E610B63|nr:hypothetical protein [Yinghuangia sp. ASG 101]UGQ15039.1 hypothetical protein LO772_16615 [Yinghuangia sp. ASG 101]
MGDTPDRIDPAGIPTFTGSLEQLSGDHASLTGDASDFRDIGDTVHTRFQGLSSVYRAPEAEDLFATTTSVRDRSDEFADDLEAVGGALSEYYDEITPLVAELKQLKSDAEAFVESIKDDDEWTYDEDKVAENNRLVTEVSTAVGQFWEAERTAANKILGLFGGEKWVANDGSGADNMYGYSTADIHAAEETPWGKTVAEDHHWYEIGYHLKSFVWDGICVEGIWGTLTGLGTLVNPWDEDFADAWEGIGKLATGLAVLATPFSWVTLAVMPDGPAKDWMNEGLDATVEFGKELIAWDDWSENPAKAAGVLTFNVVTTVASFGSGTAVEGAGLTARGVSAVAKIGEVVDPMTYIGKTATAGLKGIGALTKELTDFGAWKGFESADGTVKLPDGTVLHPDGTLDFPDNTTQAGDKAPAEMSGNDLGVLDETAGKMDDELDTGAPAGPPADSPVPALVGTGDMEFAGPTRDAPDPDAVGGDIGQHLSGDTQFGHGTGPGRPPTDFVPDVPGYGSGPHVPGAGRPFGPAPGDGVPGHGLPEGPGGSPVSYGDDAGKPPGDPGPEHPGENGIPDRDGVPDVDGDGVPDGPSHPFEGGDSPFGPDTSSPPLPRPTPPGTDVPAPTKVGDLLREGLTPEQLRPELQRAVDGEFGANGLRVEVTEVTAMPNTVTWRAEIYLDGNKVGSMKRQFVQDRDFLFVKHEDLRIDPRLRGQGFGQEFSARMETWYKNSGVQEIRLEAGSTNGGYTWAKAGYNWADEGGARAILLDMWRSRKTMVPPPSPAELERMAELFRAAKTCDFNAPGFPTPGDIANISGGTDFGKRFLTGKAWRGVKIL